MSFPFGTFNTNAVVTAHTLCGCGTALLTHFTVGAYFNAVFTGLAFGTHRHTIRAILSAGITYSIGTFGAVITFTAHCVGTVTADSAIGTVFIGTARAFATALTGAFGTVGADRTAFLTYVGTVTALLTVLAPELVGTVTAYITRSAKFIGTGGAFFCALGTYIGAVFTALSADAGYGTVTAKITSRTKAIRP